MNLNKKLSDILDPKKIEVVKNPIEKAHGLPNECYLNDDYLEFEKEKVFKNNCYQSLKKSTMDYYFTPKYLKIKWTFIIYVENC